MHDKYWKPPVRWVKLSNMGFHDLRHACATLLLIKGVHPKIGSEMLGRSSIAITLGTYSHAIPGMQEVAASVMKVALVVPCSGEREDRGSRRS